MLGRLKSLAPSFSTLSRFNPLRRFGSKKSPPLPVLPQYGGDRRRMHWFLRISLVVFCFFHGAFFAIMAPLLMVYIALPVAVVGILCIWALPEMREAPSGLLNNLFFVFIVGLIAWPNYLSIALPGMPWITVLRLTGFPLVAVLLACVSVSAKFRAEVADSLRSIPLVSRLMVIFVVIQVISVAFSRERGTSIDKLLVAQISWTAMFFTGAYVFRKPGNVERFAFLLWGLAIFVGLLATWEHKLGHPPWANHVPSFLKMDDAIDHVLQGAVRAGVGVYRAQATFSTGLGLAEYIAYVFPFVIYFAIGKYPLSIRLAAFISMPFLLLVVDYSQSRLGMVGCFVSVLASVFIAGVQKWRRDKNSIVGAAITFGYPVIFCAVVGMALSIGKVRHKLLGGGGEQSSTEARGIQWHMGFPKILSHPWGYGVGMAGDALGYVTPSGFLTIDSYFLNVVLEYGVLGFVIYFLMFGHAAAESSRRLLMNRASDHDQTFIAPLSITLLNFFIIKSVFSQADIHPLVFSMLGAIMALAARYGPAPAKVPANQAEPLVAYHPPRLTKPNGRRPDPVPGPIY